MANRENEVVTLLSSAARTATVATAGQINKSKTGVIITIDVTAIAATPSVVFTIQGFDPVSGKYYTILASAAVTGVSTVTMRVFPGCTAAANVAANDILPRDWRVNCVHGDADSITYTVSAILVG